MRRPRVKFTRRQYDLDLSHERPKAFCRECFPLPTRYAPGSIFDLCDGLNRKVDLTHRIPFDPTPVALSARKLSGAGFVIFRSPVLIRPDDLPRLFRLVSSAISRQTSFP